MSTYTYWMDIYILNGFILYRYLSKAVHACTFLSQEAVTLFSQPRICYMYVYLLEYALGCLYHIL